MKLVKHGHTSLTSWEIITPDADRRRGHSEPVPITDEDRSAHERAKVALAELNTNPWVEWPYMEDDIMVRDLKKSKWVWDETEEEFRARVEGTA